MQSLWRPLYYQCKKLNKTSKNYKRRSSQKINIPSINFISHCTTGSAKNEAPLIANLSMQYTQFTVSKFRSEPYHKMVASFFLNKLHRITKLHLAQPLTDRFFLSYLTKLRKTNCYFKYLLLIGYYPF